MRQNPIPPGRYWIDVFQKDMDRFQSWLQANKTTVNVTTTEHFDTDPPRDWFLLVITKNTPALGWDFLTIAPSSVKASEDTVQRPPPETEEPPEKLIQNVVTSLAIFAGCIYLGGKLITAMTAKM